MLLMSSIAFGLGLIMMAFLCGRIPEDDNIHLNAFDRIFSEVQLVVFAAFLFLLVAGVENIIYNTELSSMVTEVSTQLMLGTFWQLWLAWSFIVP